MTERSWVQIPPGAGLFFFSSLSFQQVPRGDAALLIFLTKMNANGLSERETKQAYRAHNYQDCYILNSNWVVHKTQV